MSDSGTTPRDIETIEAEIVSLLPTAARGSVSLVHKRCVNKECQRCASGEKHPAYIYGFKRNRRHYCRHVPDDLAPKLKAAIANGRRIEELLSEMGEAMIMQYRRKRDAKAAK